MSELTELNVHDLNLENLSIRVYGKGRKERIIPILPPLAKQLQLYLANRKEKLGEKVESATFYSP